MPSASSRSSRARIFSVAAALVMLAGLSPQPSEPSIHPARRHSSIQIPATRSPPIPSSPDGCDRRSEVPRPDFDRIGYDPARLQPGHRQPQGHAAADLPLGLSIGVSRGRTAAPALDRSRRWARSPRSGAPLPSSMPFRRGHFNFPTEPVLFDWQPLAGARATLEIDTTTSSSSNDRDDEQ